MTSVTAPQSPRAVREAILPWLVARLGHPDEIALPSPQTPTAGGSSTTFFLDPVFRTSGAEQRLELVLRIEATGYQIYQDPSVERQFQVMRTLHRLGGVPVPRCLWFEADPRLLGAPFFVMERVRGEVPDSSYHQRGLLAAASPAERRGMWESALAALASVHRTDAAQFPFLARPQQELAVWAAYAEWTQAPRRDVQERAFGWLQDQRPGSTVTGLAWGDARLPNMIFRDNECGAIIDWETASLAGAETDLGWWLCYDWLISDGRAIPRLDGLGDRATTLSAWEQLVGRKAQAIQWHETFATLRLSLITDRALQLAGDTATAAAIRSSSQLIADRLAALLWS